MAARAAALLLLLLPPASGTIELNNSQPVEYEQREADGWRWFVLPTADVAAVAVSLVCMRGYSQNFPRIGFVAMASSSGRRPRIARTMAALRTGRENVPCAGCSRRHRLGAGQGFGPKASLA